MSGRLMSGLPTVWKTRRHQVRGRMVAAGLTAVLSAVLGAYGVRQGFDGIPLVATLLAFAAFMLPYLLLTSSSFQRDLKVWLRVSGWRGLAAFVIYVNIVYLIYSFATDCFEWNAWARLFAFVALPTCLVATVRPARTQGPRWQDWLAIAAVWLPFDSGFLSRIWAWPEGEGAYILNTALAVTLAVALFASYRNLPGINIRFSLSRREAALVLACLVGFVAVAVPFGLATGFLRFNPQLQPLKVFIAPIGILLFIGLPEELLFRGLVQNLLQRKLARPWMALVIASIFFGLTHYNNTPSPDWRYLFLATVAGLFYGYTFMRSRSLLAPALLHTLVDTIWLLLLHTGEAQ